MVIRSAAVAVCSALVLTPSAAAQVAFDPVTDYAVGMTPVALAVADFDGDLDLDLAVANFGSANLSILLGSGSGSFFPGGSVATRQQSDLGRSGRFQRRLGSRSGGGRAPESARRT